MSLSKKKKKDKKRNLRNVKKDIQDEITRDKVRQKVKNKISGGHPARTHSIRKSAVQKVMDGEASSIDEAVKKARKEVRKMEEEEDIAWK